MEPAAHTLGTEAVEAETGRPAQLECDHFSMRGYVAQRQKKDPKLCSLQIFCEGRQYAEQHNNLSPLFVAKYQRWNCSKCLDRVKNSGHRTTSQTVSMQRDGANDGCSISIIRTLPYSVGSRRSCSGTRQSFQGSDADQSTLSKSAQECNSKCSSPSDNKAVTAVNVPATSAERNVPDTFVERSVPETKDLQNSLKSHHVLENILNNVCMDIGDLPDVRQMISSKDGNGTQSRPCSPKHYQVPNADENRTAQDVSHVDRTESSVPKPISGHKGSKKLYGHRSNNVLKQGPRRAVLKGTAGSEGKKVNKSTDLAGISYRIFSKRKAKKMRLISELIDTPIGGAADAIEADRAKTGNLCESDKSTMPLEVGDADDTPVSNQKVRATLKRTSGSEGKMNVNKSTDLAGISYRSFSKRKAKKMRLISELIDTPIGGAADAIEADRAKTDNLCESDKSTKPLEVGDADDTPVSNQKVRAALKRTSGSEGGAADAIEADRAKTGNLCESDKSTMPLEVGDADDTPVSNQKVSEIQSTVVKNNEKITGVDNVHGGSSLMMTPSREHKIQNVSGLCKQNIPKNKTKHRLEVHEKQTVIDDIPMDIVEFLDRNHHERQRMTDTDSSENRHTRPKIAAVDCAEIAAKKGPINASAVLETNFQKSLASESKQKSSQCRASSSTKADNVHLQKSSQCHAMHRPELHMQNSVKLCIVPDILEDTQQQQTHFCWVPQHPTIVSHHQHIAEVPTKTWNNKGEKKLMWDLFKASSRNSPTSTYSFEFQNGNREVDLVPIPEYGASRDYSTQNVGSQYEQYNHYNASSRASYGSHLEKVPLTLQDMAQHQVEKNLHRPLRPHPRAGVFGSLLQQDIANWSENCGTQSGYRLFVSKGTVPFDMNREEINYGTLNSGMLPVGWNDVLQLRTVASVANPEHPLPRYDVAQAWTGGTGKTVDALDKLDRKDICQTNRNPSDFTVIGDKNEYMINL